MTEQLILAHWLTIFFVVLMWSIEQLAHRWIGYRFVYRLYAGLPLLMCFAIFSQMAEPLIQVPEIVASLSVASTVPVAVTRHVNIL